MAITSMPPVCSRLLWCARLGTLFLAVGFVVPAVGQETAPAPVVVAPAIRRVIRESMSFVGSVRAPVTSRVSTAVDGRIARLLVEEGQRVAKGEVIAELETDLIEAQLAAAVAELVLRKEELRELENGSRPEEIEEARAAVEAAKAVAARRETYYQRIQDLFRRGGAREDDLDDARAAYLEAKAALDQAEAKLKLVERGPREEQIAQAKARVEAQEHRVQELRIRLEKHRIRAPFNGYVTQKLADVGTWVREGDAICELIDLDVVDAEITVPEDYIARVQPGTEATVQFPALPDRIFVGRVHRIIPRAIATSRAFPVRLRVTNEIGADGIPAIKEGYFLRASLPLGEPRETLLVHKDALILGGQNPLVAVVDRTADNAEIGSIRLVPVLVGSYWQDWVEIKGSLREGDLVVVRGNERLRPGQPARIAEVRAAPLPPDHTTAGATQ